MSNGLNICGFSHSLKAAADPKVEKKKDQISGYFAVYGTTSELICGYKRWKWEVGCFDESLADDSKEIYMLNQHDWEQVLGRRSKGTASFSADSTGLMGVCTPNMEKPIVQGLMADLARGDIDAGSVGFFVLTDDWSLEDGYDIQHLMKVQLEECSPVTLPRFTSTDGLVCIMPASLPKDEQAALRRALNRASRDLSWINQDDRELLRAHRSELEPNLTANLVAALDRHGVPSRTVTGGDSTEPVNVIAPITLTEQDNQLRVAKLLNDLYSI